MKLEVSSSVITAVMQEAARAAPQEACGLLLGQMRPSKAAVSLHLPTANVAQTPFIHFEIDPQALIDAHRAAREGGPAVVGYYHSHPSGPPCPSATDRAQASADGRVWAIAGEGQLRFWRDTAEGFIELFCSATPE